LCIDLGASTIEEQIRLHEYMTRAEQTRKEADAKAEQTRKDRERLTREADAKAEYVRKESAARVRAIETQSFAGFGKAQFDGLRRMRLLESHPHLVTDSHGQKRIRSSGGDAKRKRYETFADWTKRNTDRTYGPTNEIPIVFQAITSLGLTDSAILFGLNRLACRFQQEPQLNAYGITPKGIWVNFEEGAAQIACSRSPLQKEYLELFVKLVRETPDLTNMSPLLLRLIGPASTTLGNATMEALPVEID
jgi:hypothetical protein